MFDEYGKEVSKRMKIEQNMNILASFTSSIFQDFEVISDQKSIWLILILHWFR